MITPAALAAAAMGLGSGPTVVSPSVNITITRALVEGAASSSDALVKASAWLVLPPAVSASTAAFRSATEVISWVSCVAVLAKLTTAMRLPEPIWPSCVPSVASSIMSINAFAPFFRFASALPAILPDRSRISTMSVGFDTISGAAVNDSFT